MTEPEEDALPRWLLGTPTRNWEWWGNPALLAVVAIGLAVGAVIVPEPVLVRAMATLIAVAMLTGAVVLAWAGRVAYLEQDRDASWSLHTVAVLVGNGSATVVALLGLAAGEPVLAFAAALSLLSVRRWLVNARPRFDVAATMCAEAVIGATALVTVVVDLVARRSDGSWSLPAVLVGSFAVSLFLDARALRTAPAR